MKKILILMTMLNMSLMVLNRNDVQAITVVSSLYSEKTSTSGVSYTDIIKIYNNKKKAVDVKLYQTDYHYFSDGTNQFGEPGQGFRSNAKWIGKLPQQISILPEQTTLLQYSVTVPKDASLCGSYWSMIMLEELDEEEFELLSSGNRQMGIKQITRYAVQVVTHIGNTGSRQLEFRTLKLVNDEGRRFLRIDMENSGTRALRPFLSVDIHAESGGYSKKIDGKHRCIFPDCSITEQLDFSDIPPGAYKAVIVADTGEETVFGTSFSIKLKE